MIVLYWNIEHFRQGLLREDFFRNHMFEVLKRADIAFLIENKKNTDDLCAELCRTLRSKFMFFENVRVFPIQMAGYRETNEKMIIVDRGFFTTIKGAINEQGEKCDGSANSSERFPAFVQIRNSDLKFAGVHFPRPSTGDNDARLTKWKPRMVKNSVILVGGDWNTGPPLPGGNDALSHIGPFQPAAAAGPQPERTMIDEYGNRRNPYDWVLAQKGMFANLRVTVFDQYGGDTAVRRKISDHLPIMVEFDSDVLRI